jgi:hypothetical protein
MSRARTWRSSIVMRRFSETFDRRTIKRHDCNLRAGAAAGAMYEQDQKREQSCDTDSFHCNHMLRRGLHWNSFYDFFGVGTGTPAIFTVTAATRYARLVK